VLEATQCPLCERWIVDGEITKTRSGVLARRFVHRWDLQEFVCERCDYELGPDTVRLKAIEMSKNAEEMLAMYLASWIPNDWTTTLCRT